MDGDVRWSWVKTFRLHEQQNITINSFSLLLVSCTYTYGLTTRETVWIFADDSLAQNNLVDHAPLAGRVVAVGGRHNVVVVDQGSPALVQDLSAPVHLERSNEEIELN